MTVSDRAAAGVPTVCGGAVHSRRGLLASLWSAVVGLTALSFMTALIFTLSAAESDSEYYSDNYDGYYDADGKEQEQQEQQNNEGEATMAVTSRAMAFAALWTAVLATLMAIFGAVILGWQSPTGVYYTCCSPAVHRTTPLSLGSFIGALLMFANLTLVCSVLFGEFDIRDYREGGGEDKEAAQEDTAVRRSSMAFSIMCMVLTVLYAGFAALTFAYSHSVLDELLLDEQDEEHRGNNSNSDPTHFVGGSYHHHHQQHHHNDGFIGGQRFDVRRTTGPSGFVAPQPDKTII